MITALLAVIALLLLAQVVMLYLLLKGLLELRTGKDAGGLYKVLHAVLADRRPKEEWGMEQGRPVL